MVLLERDDELAVVGRALREASCGTGRVIVVAGPLGNGKTALLRAIQQHPDAAGFTVVKAAASPAERGFPYGVVRQLLEPLLGDASKEVWQGAAAFARPVFAPEPTSNEPAMADVGHEVRRGLFALGCNLLKQPYLTLVDDLQSVDAGSLDVLVSLSRRITHLRAVLVVTVREGHPFADQSAVVWITGRAAHRLQPAPLRPAGSAALIRDRLGRECADEFTLACHEATGGNPMLLNSLALAWAVSGQAPVATAADVVRTMRTPQGRDRLVARMREQSGPEKALLTAMAVLVDTGEPRIAGMLAGLDETAAAEATRGLRKLGLLAGDEFAHPSVRDAAKELMTSDERESLRLRAIRLLYDNGMPDEQVANQLLRITVPQGPWAVQTLRGAADTALRRGSAQTAARYLRRALLDTSVDGADRAKVLIDLAAVEHRFDPPGAVRTMSYTVSLLSEPRDRAAAIIQLAPTVLGDAPPAVATLLRDVAGSLGDPAQLAGTERELALRVEARLRHMGQMNSMELDYALARLAALEPDVPMTTGADRELLAVLLHCATISARRPSVEVAALAEDLLAHEPASSSHVSGAAALVVTSLLATGSPGRVMTWLDQAFDAAVKRGDAVEQAMISVEQSLVYLLSGRIGEATRVAREVFDLGAWEWNAVSSSAAVTAGAVALQLRDQKLTEQVLASASASAQPVTGCLAAIVGLLRGSAAAWRGDLHTAVALVAECGRTLDRSGWRNPVLFPWRTSLALLRQRLGQVDEAMALAEEERLIAQEWGAASGIGRAWRVLGALSGGERGAELTGRAVEVLETSADRMELALALRQWATMSARVDLWQRCLDVAVEIGADKIAENARAALDSGGSVYVARLTPSERRVALLAAKGSSNPEIAKALTVTSRTVEKHLTNTYRKLGVRGRVELADALRQLDPSH